MVFLSIFVYFYNFIISFFLKKWSYSVVTLFYAPYFFFIIFFACSNLQALSVDYSTYVNWISYIVTEDGSDYLDRKDPLFQYLVTFFWMLFNNIDYILFALISISLFFKYIIGILFLSRDLLWLYFILIFSRLYILQDVTQLRASLAISLCMVGYFFYSKKLKIFILPFVLAFFMHKSVIIFLIILPLLKLRTFYEKKNLNLIIMSATILFYNFSSVITGVFFSKFVDSRVQVYADGNYVNNSTISIFSFYVLLKYAMLSMNYLIWDKLNDNDKRINLFVALGLIFQTIFASNAVLGWRFSEILAFFDIFSLLMVFKYINKEIRYLYFMYCCLVGVLALYATYFSQN